MTTSELTRALNPDDILDLLWLYDFPAGEISGPGSVIGTAVQSPFWWGSVKTEQAADGQISVIARVSYTGLPQILPTELEQLNFLVLLCRGDRLSAKFQAVPGSRQVATATVSFAGEFAELTAAALLIADDNRYCFEHTHCAGCGRVAPAGPDTEGWCQLLDNGPGDLPLYVCDSPDCWFDFDATHNIHPASH